MQKGWKIGKSPNRYYCLQIGLLVFDLQAGGSDMEGAGLSTSRLQNVTRTQALDLAYPSCFLLYKRRQNHFVLL